MANQDPNQAEIITKTAFGGRSAVALKGNRYSIKSEAVYKSANFIALPARGGVVDAAFWISGLAFAFRLPLSLLISGWLPAWVALLAFAGVALPLLYWLGVVSKELPNHRPDCWARLAMMIAAIAVATNLFWIRG